MTAMSSAGPEVSRFSVPAASPRVIDDENIMMLMASPKVEPTTPSRSTGAAIRAAGYSWCRSPLRRSRPVPSITSETVAPSPACTGMGSTLAVIPVDPRSAAVVRAATGTASEMRSRPETAAT
ncbi:hypothetical protein GCM10027289_15470 [Tsukamurella serpentis]